VPDMHDDTSREFGAIEKAITSPYPDATITTVGGTNKECGTTVRHPSAERHGGAYVRAKLRRVASVQAVFWNWWGDRRGRAVMPMRYLT